MNNPLEDKPIVKFGGETVLLECPVMPESSPIFYEWAKGEDVIEDHTPRFKVNEDTGILRIRNAKVADSGTYYCSAVNGNGETRVAVDLEIQPQSQSQNRGRITDQSADGSEVMSTQVRHPLRPSANNGNSINNPKFYRPILLDVTSSGTPGNRYAGDNVTIRCRFQARPVADIKWYFKQILITQKIQQRKYPPFMLITTTTSGDMIDTKLIITKVQENSTGRYLCQASNKKGSKAGSTELVIPPGTRPIIIGEHPLNSTFVEGQTIRLDCRVSSEDRPTIQWVRKTNITEFSTSSMYPSSASASQSLFQSRSDRIRMRSETLSPDVSERGNHLYESVLIIPNANLNDSGLYMCTALNPIHRSLSWREAHVTIIPRQDSVLIPPRMRASMDSNLINKAIYPTPYVPVDNPLIFWMIGLGIVLLSIAMLALLLGKTVWNQKKMEQQQNSCRSRRRLASRTVSTISSTGADSIANISPNGGPGSTPRLKRKVGNTSAVSFSRNHYEMQPKIVSAPAQIHNVIVDDDDMSEGRVSLTGLNNNNNTIEMTNLRNSFSNNNNGNISASPPTCSCPQCFESQVERLRTLDRKALHKQRQNNITGNSNSHHHSHNKSQNNVNHHYDHSRFENSLQRKKKNQASYHHSLQRKTCPSPSEYYASHQSSTLSRNYYYPKAANPDEIEVLN